MDQPKVVAICLTSDRQAFTDRAWRCFEAQDYANAQLLILDSGKRQWEPEGCSPRRVYYQHKPAYIGTLRNAAIAIAHLELEAEIIVHWDSDDYSGPTRISTQVKHLQESGAAAVGYREMLFWHSVEAQAWLYSNSDPRYIVGTSLCYWVSAWQEAGGFADCHHGEDDDFLKRLRAVGKAREGAGFRMDREVLDDGTEYSQGIHYQKWKPGKLLLPVVAEIHGGNTIKQHIFVEAVNTDGSPQWQRKPDWDTHLRELMEGA